MIYIDWKARAEQATAQLAETRERLERAEGLLREVLPWAEIGFYLWDARSACYGDGYTQPYERTITWDWQQSRPDDIDFGAMENDVAEFLADLSEDGAPDLPVFRARAYFTPDPVQKESPLRAKLREVTGLYEALNGGPNGVTREVDELLLGGSSVAGVPCPQMDTSGASVRLEGFWPDVEYIDELVGALLRMKNSDFSRQWSTNFNSLIRHAPFIVEVAANQLALLAAAKRRQSGHAEPSGKGGAS